MKDQNLGLWSYYIKYKFYRRRIYSYSKYKPLIVRSRHGLPLQHLDRLITESGHTEFNRLLTLLCMSFTNIDGPAGVADGPTYEIALVHYNHAGSCLLQFLQTCLNSTLLAKTTMEHMTSIFLMLFLTSFVVDQSAQLSHFNTRGVSGSVFDEAISLRSLGTYSSACSATPSPDPRFAHANHW